MTSPNPWGEVADRLEPEEGGWKPRAEAVREGRCCCAPRRGRVCLDLVKAELWVLPAEFYFLS